MKPNCFYLRLVYLRLDRSKLKNGYYRVLMGLAGNFWDLTMLLEREFHWLSSMSWSLCFYFNLRHLPATLIESRPTVCEEQLS